MEFKLKSAFSPTGDQPQAIDRLVNGLNKNLADQVLLGVTGSGKTFTLANVIAKIQKPTLVISHNKTLAGQLYQEFRDFFPENAVSYFVSYYDYYQPEAYIPRTDTYIEKETEINEEIDKLRLSATMNLLTRKDVIVVASVSCIYNIGSPKEYGNYIINLKIKDQKSKLPNIVDQLVDLQYKREDYDFTRGTFRIKADSLYIWPAYQDNALRIDFSDDLINQMIWVDPLTGKQINNGAIEQLNNVAIYPAKHYMVNPDIFETAFSQIRHDLKLRLKELADNGKILEAHRLEQRVNYDLEMIAEFGYVNGIENYSRYFDSRTSGQAPYTLLDYFPKDYLLVLDESHMSLPQIRGMYFGDRSRKQTLIDFGFRLPSCLDNRPLKFDEFQRRMGRTVYTSATPNDWELSRAGKNGLVEQLVRPTGILDPKIEIRPTQNQVPDLVAEIIKRKADGQRVLVTTLTKRLAEAIAEYFINDKQMKAAGINIQYLHSEIQTLDRQDILDDLRQGKYDVLVGINLLREGLDLPEVSLVAILDADKEGFLRSQTSLVQTMGRAARHISGKVILYADTVTGSMKRAIDEVSRRRSFQKSWNEKYNITPVSIQKPVREKLVNRTNKEQPENNMEKLKEVDYSQLAPEDQKKHLKSMREIMRQMARDLQFEQAAKLRDQIKKLEVGHS